jgi:hypothetical protein
MLHQDDVMELLHEARLGLTRLQLYSVLSVAEINGDGFLNYMQFIPKAVSVVRSMLSFESDLVDQVEGREAQKQLAETIATLPNPCKEIIITEAISGDDRRAVESM